MKSKQILLILFFIISFRSAFSQELGKADSMSDQNEKQKINHRHSIGSSLFLLGNFAPGDHPYFFQLNYGYHITPKDSIIFEAITWTYYEPLGTYGSSDELYPGKVRSYGIGVGYQRFFWKGLYSTIQATPFLQQFFDKDGKKIQKGFQLYLQLRIGYRLEFFNDCVFIEPSVAFNYWPINTNFPKSFDKIENGSANYFLFEPGLHFGVRF